MRSQGFTLLEVMVALFILAVVAVTVSQGVHQRSRTSLVEAQRLPLILCARTLGNEFAITRYWPAIGRQEGELELAGQTCYWRMDVESTAVRDLRRGDLALFTDPTRTDPELHFSLFLAP